MDALSTLQLAEELRGLTGDSFIVIDAHNDGGSGRWQPSFPSLDETNLAKLGDVFVLRFTARSSHTAMVEAQEAFTHICRDIADENASLLSGTITYVGVDWEYYWKDDAFTRTIEFDIADDDSRPAFEDCKLDYVQIAERI